MESAQQIGISVETFANWEYSRSIPDICHLPKIIEFLGFDPLKSGKKTD
jgi:transcriptional regulator with XRE-family HTH domain